MNSIYFAISPYDQINISLGFSMAHDLSLGCEISELFHEEVTLVHTGWASNSFQLFVVAKTKQEVDYFISLVKTQFNELLKLNYDVKNVSEIVFDDENFENEFKELMNFIQSKYPSVEEMNSYYRIEY